MSDGNQFAVKCKGGYQGQQASVLLDYFGEIAERRKAGFFEHFAEVQRLEHTC
jgi:hypothetical protein